GAGCAGDLRPAAARPAAIAGGVIGFVHGVDEPLDAGAQRADLGGQRIDLTQQQPRQLGVVVIEATVERSDELRALGFHPAAGKSASRRESRSPPMRASTMSRVDSVSSFEATADTL